MTDTLIREGHRVFFDRSKCNVALCCAVVKYGETWVKQLYRKITTIICYRLLPINGGLKEICEDCGCKRLHPLRSSHAMGTETRPRILVSALTNITLGQDI